MLLYDSGFQNNGDKQGLMKITFLKKIRLQFQHLLSYGFHGRFLLFLTGFGKRGKRNALDVQLREIEYRFVNLPSTFDGFRILLLSDFHIDHTHELCDVIINKIRNITDIDVVCMTGDYRARVLGDFSYCLNYMKKIVDILHPRYGIFGVRGNHDSPKMTPALEEIGITMLNNASSVIEKDGEHLYIAGVEDPHIYKTADVQKAVEGIPRSACTILLAHSPEVYQEASEHSINLYLCGHTHGGQIVFPKIGALVKNMRAPGKCMRGFWKHEGMTGFTTTGVGTSAINARFNCPPEIVLFTLHRVAAENNDSAHRIKSELSEIN